jgi:hypothetical protein
MLSVICSHDFHALIRCNIEMKKIISVCLCICLMSGCGKSLSHGRPANAVVEDKGSEGVPTHSLTSDASNIPAPTPEPSKSALSSDSALYLA